MLIYILVLTAGLLQSVMQSFNGLLQGYVGLFGTSLMTHLIGGLLLILYILLIRRERIRLWPMPWHLYSAGFLGLTLVACTSLCVSQIGPALTTCLSISGQLVASILMDHFGWMGVQQIRFQKKRICCLLVILAGLLIVNFGDETALATGLTGGKIALCIPLAFLLGGVNVYSKTVNFQATKYLGTANGTLVNYVVASFLSALLLVCFEREHAAAAAFAAAPVWLYLGGVSGVVALVINVISLKKINLFQSTTLLLVGQLAGSAALDAVLFENMSPLKLLGVVIVGAGVVWDKKLSLPGGQ